MNSTAGSHLSGSQPSIPTTFPEVVHKYPPREVRASTPIVFSECKGPSFIEKPDSEINIPEGNDLQLSCRVAGDPRPRGNDFWN